MTGEEWLNVDDADKQAAQDLGSEIANRNNPNAISDLAKWFLDHDMIDDASRVLGMMTDATNSMAEDINSATGWNVRWADNLYGGRGGWVDVDTGHFMGMFRTGESPDYKLTNDEYKQSLRDKFGVNPDA